MPASDSGTYLTYSNANTRISGNSNRSSCTLFRASISNDNNILVEIGSSETSIGSSAGCNRHFAIGIANSTNINVFAMCYDFDNPTIDVGPNSLYDGAFHQVCVTYNNINSNLCVYRDSQTPKCLTRTNALYNTGSGDVRIGWWPDNNRQFSATGGGLIKSASLFDSPISANCVAYLLSTYN